MTGATKRDVIVLAVVEGGMSVAEAARVFSVSRRWIHVLLARHKLGGIDAVGPRSRAPRTSPARTSDQVRARVLQLREQLASEGLDAGAETIHDHLVREVSAVPSVSTIWRILRACDVVVPQPQKRPRSSWIRFEAALPNETWQSDMTHWQLAGDVPVEIITWLDDHSRMVMHLSCHQVVTAQIVVDTFITASETHGLPASTLTDNGRIYTTRHATGTPGLGQFEQLIHDLGIVQKNGHPYHPQTQGKIERFHQTLKKWLSARPAPATLTALQDHLDAFTQVYNHERAHRALSRATPAQAWHALPPAAPSITIAGRHYRIRFDHIDATGVVSVRFAGRMLHLGIGRAHKHRPVMVLIAGHHAMTIDRETSEILAEHTLNPNKDYHPKNK